MSNMKKNRHALGLSNDSFILARHKCFELSEIDLKISCIQPKVILDRLTKQQLDEYLKPSTGDIQYNNLTLDLNENMAFSKKNNKSSDQTVEQVPSSMIFACRKNIDANLIDYMSSQWQPNIRIKNLSKSYLKDFDRYESNENETFENSWLRINPIEFDRDESLIKELSPQRATEQFQMVTLEILCNISNMQCIFCILF